jgi:enamine deaminase RidA (YjgF/YER057c/UK114 family)
LSERRRIVSAAELERRYGYSRAIVVGDRVLVAGTAPIMPENADPQPDAYAQARRCLDIILAALREAGAGPEHVVRTRIFLTSAKDGDAVARAHASVLGEARPVSTMVVVEGFLDPRWKVEIEAEAVVPSP